MLVIRPVNKILPTFESLETTARYLFQDLPAAIFGVDAAGLEAGVPTLLLLSFIGLHRLSAVDYIQSTVHDKMLLRGVSKHHVCIVNA